MLSRTCCLLILTALVAPDIWAQEATTTCPDGRTIRIASQWDQPLASSDLAAQPIRYSISRPQGVQGAWVEVWDRPTRLSRNSVPVVPEGKAKCTNCLDAEQTPRELYVSIFDAEEPLICIDYCPKGTAMSGWYLSETMAGKQPEDDYEENEEPAYLLESPSLTGEPVRVLAGSGSTTVVLPGENLLPSSRVYLDADKGAPPKDASRTYLYSRTIDLRHVEVMLPSDILEKPQVFRLHIKDSWNGDKPEGPEDGQKIIVARKDSPTIDSIKPDAMRCCRTRDSDATVVLRGRGFTEHSEVKAGDDPYLHPAITFVSSHELRVTFPDMELKDGSERYSRAKPLSLTVVNGPLQISAPGEIHVLPSARFRPDPLPATIRAIAPYPVPMMDFHSPKFLTLDINGDNFRSNDVVAFRNEDSETVRLRTQYLSPHHLRAWLPRESWRKHRLSFRLVIQTPAGFCAAEAFANSLE